MGRLGEREPAAVGRLADAAAADERIELAGVWTHFATADEDDDALPRASSSSASARSRLPIARAPSRDHAARRQQRRDAARSRVPLRHGPLRRRGLRARPVRRDAAAPRPRAGARAALLRRRRQALPRRRVRRLRPDLEGARRHLGRRCCRSATATATGAGSRTRPRSLIRGRRFPVVGTISMDNITVDLGPETEVEPGRARGPDRRAGRRAGQRRAARASASARSTTRSPAGLSARVPRAYRT